MPQTVGPMGMGTVGYRIRQGNVIGLTAMAFQTSLTPFGGVRVVFDDGTEDDLYFDPSIVTTAGSEFTAITKPAKKDGWILSGAVGMRATGFPARTVTGYGLIFLLTDVNGSGMLGCLGSGPIGARDVITVGQYTPNDFKGLYVFQGTVAEDATAGTHVSSLTLTPGTGNSFKLLYARILAGAGAANITSAFINDGTNNITLLVNALSLASGQEINIPTTIAPAAGGVTGGVGQVELAGTMQLKLQISTATVSLTHTFSLAGLVKNDLPSVTLADSLGTPTLTTNTDGVF